MRSRGVIGAKTVHAARASRPASAGSSPPRSSPPRSRAVSRNPCSSAATSPATRRCAPRPNGEVTPGSRAASPPTRSATAAGPGGGAPPGAPPQPVPQPLAESARVRPVGPEQLHPRQLFPILQQLSRTVPIGEVGAVDPRGQHQPTRDHQDVALPSGQTLRSVVAAFRSAYRGVSSRPPIYRTLRT